MSNRHEAVAEYLSVDTQTAPLGLYPVDDLKRLTRACGSLVTLPPNLAPHVASMHMELAQSLITQGRGTIEGQVLHDTTIRAMQAGKIGASDTENPLRGVHAELLGASAGLYLHEVSGRKETSSAAVTVPAWRQVIRRNIERAYKLYDPEGSDLHFMQTLGALGIFHYIEEEGAPSVGLAPTRLSQSPDITGSDLLRIDPEQGTRTPVRIADQHFITHYCLAPRLLGGDLYEDTKGIGHVRAAIDHFTDDARRKNRAQKGGPITKPKPPHVATQFLSEISKAIAFTFAKQDEIRKRQGVSKEDSSAPEAAPDDWYELLSSIAEPRADANSVRLFDLSLSQKQLDYQNGDMGVLDVYELAWMYAERAIGDIHWRNATTETEILGDLDVAEDLLTLVIDPAKKKHKEQVAKFSRGTHYEFGHDLLTVQLYRELLTHPENVEEDIATFRQGVAHLAGQALEEYDNPDTPLDQRRKLARALQCFSISMLMPAEVGVTLRANARQMFHSDHVNWDLTAFLMTDTGIDIRQRHKLRAQYEPDAMSIERNNIATVDYDLLHGSGTELPDFAPLRHALGLAENEEAHEKALEKILGLIDRLRPA